MPNSQQNNLQDSGICSDLLKRLSLGDVGSDTNELCLKTYFEPDEDGDVQVGTLTKMSPKVFFSWICRVSDNLAAQASRLFLIFC